jgi:hypothetical protein
VEQGAGSRKKPKGKFVKAKTVGQTWRLKYGLLYAGLRGVMAKPVLVSGDEAEVFDSRDNPEMKARYYGALLNCKFEVETIN